MLDRVSSAGDLTGDAEDAIATMFCLAGPDMPDINEQDLRRHDKLNEITTTVGEALLGLQLHCAQCHDHKYDAISIADFYRLRPVFESAVPPMKRDRPVLTLTSVEDPPAARVHHRGDLDGAGHLSPSQLRGGRRRKGRSDSESQLLGRSGKPVAGEVSAPAFGRRDDPRRAVGRQRRPAR